LHFLRHAGRQINSAVLIVQFDTANVGAGQVGFVGNSANNVTWVDVMVATNSYTETLHSNRLAVMFWTWLALALFTTFAIWAFVKAYAFITA
jgi:hypothetical protein